MGKRIVYYGATGGAGCTLMTALHATAGSLDNPMDVEECDTFAALAAMLGLPNPAPNESLELTPGVTLYHSLPHVEHIAAGEEGTTLTDAGKLHGGELLHATEYRIVCRTDYISLRRLALLFDGQSAHDWFPSPTKFIFEIPAGAALTPADAMQVLNLRDDEVLGSVLITGEIGRCVDAGLLLVRTPTALRRLRDALTEEV